MARLVVAAVVGVAVGWATGNPYYGLQAFSLVYGVTGFLDPNKKVSGPRLNDLRAPSASYGSPIPYLEGAPRLAGVFFWASEKREISTTTTVDKGGPGVDSTTYTYEIDCLIGLASNVCAAIRRVWSNGRLIWSQADDADDITLGASGDIPDWRDMRFYTGASDQLPDPTYEAAVGVGNAPAYRGRATVFIEGLNLGGSGQLPILTFEVVTEAGDSFSVVQMTSFEHDYPFAQGTPAFSLTDTFYFFKPGDDIDPFNGRLLSFDSYTCDPATGDVAFYAHVDIGEHNWATMLGNSDESLFAAFEFGGSPVLFVDLYDPIGATVRLDVSTTGFSAHYFSKIGDDIVLCQTGVTTDDRKLRRYRRSNGALMATAAVALPSNLQSCAIGGAFVYSLSEDGTTVYKSDLVTLALVETISIPATWNAAQGEIACAGDTPYVLGIGSVESQYPLIKWNGSSWELVAYYQNSSGVPHEPDPTPSLANLYANPIDSGRLGVSPDGTIFSQVYTAGPPNVVHINYLVHRVGIVEPTLDQVVRRLCLRTGQLTDSDITVSALASQIVRAMAITQTSPIRTTLDMLSGAYLFEFCEGATLKCVPRGGAPAVTIPFEDLGASTDGMAEPLPKKRTNEAETPAKVSIKYANVLNDFQDGLESGDRLVSESNAVSVVEIPLGFTPAEAKKLADVQTMDLVTSLIQIGPIQVGLDYARLEVTDVVELIDEDGSSFRARIMKGSISNGVYTLELVLDDATVVNSVVATDADYTSSTLIRVLGNTDLELLDIPILRDADDSPGIYAAFSSTGRWPGAELDKSIDDTTYNKVLSTNVEATKGRATTILGDFDGGIVFDEVNSVTVNLGDGELSSSTRAALLSSSVNAMVIGHEIIQFRIATLVSAGVYTLTGLLRGRRGTEWAMPDHVANEHVVLLEAATLRRVSDSSADRGLPYYWKAVTFGKSRGSASSQTFTDTGVGLKPFSPVDLRVLPNEIDDLVFSWNRRSRLATRFVGSTGSSVPLGETIERYHYEVLVSSAVVLSGYVLTPTVSLSKGSQLAAGIAVGVDATFRVAQVSAAVGDGYFASIDFGGTGVAQPQISTVTVGGTYQSGKPLYVLIDTTTAPYTTTVPDATLAGVATSLAAAIQTALPTYTATALSNVITITGPAGHAFTISAGMVGEEAFDTGLLFAAAAAGPGTNEKIIVSISPILPGVFTAVPGNIYTIRAVRGYLPVSYDRSVNYTYTATSAFDALQLFAAIVGGPRTTSDGLPAGIAYNYVYGFDNFPQAIPPIGEYWEFTGFSTDPNFRVVGTLVQLPEPARPSDVAQVNRALITNNTVFPPALSTPAGYIYRMSINGVAYDYTVVGGDDWFDVLLGLKTAINGGSVVVTADDAYYIANASTGQPPQLIVTAVTGNVPFTIDSRLIPGLINLTTALVQAAS